MLQVEDVRSILGYLQEMPDDEKSRRLSWMKRLRGIMSYAVRAWTKILKTLSGPLIACKNICMSRCQHYKARISSICVLPYTSSADRCQHCLTCKELHLSHNSSIRIMLKSVIT